MLSEHPVVLFRAVVGCWVAFSLPFVHRCALPSLLVARSLARVWCDLGLSVLVSSPWAAQTFAGLAMGRRPPFLPHLLGCIRAACGPPRNPYTFTAVVFYCLAFSSVGLPVLLRGARSPHRLGLSICRDASPVRTLRR